jgi:hypothetical protein
MTGSSSESWSAVDRLVAESSIRDVLTRYCRGADRCDPALMLSSFTADASIGIGGRQLPAAKFAGAITSAGRESAIESSHHLTNIHIELAQHDQAIAESYFLNVRTTSSGAEDGRTVTIVSGRYLDALRRVDDQWLITERAIVIEAAADGIAASDYPPLQTNLRGASGDADPFIDFRSRHVADPR